MRKLTHVPPSRAPVKPSRKNRKSWGDIKKEPLCEEWDYEHEDQQVQEESEKANPVADQPAFAGCKGEDADPEEEHAEYGFANSNADQPAYAGCKSEDDADPEEAEQEDEDADQQEEQGGYAQGPPSYSGWEGEDADQQEKQGGHAQGPPAYSGWEGGNADQGQGGYAEGRPAYPCWEGEDADHQEEQGQGGYAQGPPAYAGWEGEDADQQEEQGGYAQGPPAYSGWEGEDADQQEAQDEHAQGPPAYSGWEGEDGDQQEEHGGSAQGPPAYSGWEGEDADQGQPAHAGWEGEDADHQEEQGQSGYAQGPPAYSGWEGEDADQQEAQDEHAQGPPAYSGWEGEDADHQEEHGGYAQGPPAYSGWEGEDADQQEAQDGYAQRPPAYSGWEGEDADQQEAQDGYAQRPPAYSGWEGEDADQGEGGYAEGWPAHAGWEGEDADQQQEQAQHGYAKNQPAYTSLDGEDACQGEEWKKDANQQEQWTHDGATSESFHNWSCSKQGYWIKWGSSEAKLMLTMRGFVKWHISRMIGKRGSNLLELARASGCKVHLCGRDSNRPTDEPNYLMIRGSRTLLENAVEMACQKVTEVLDTDIPICELCGADHKSRDCPKAGLPFVHKIFLKDTKVGFIIGSKGRNVAPIKEATGALIRMCGLGSGELHASEPLHMRIECKTQEFLDTAVQMANSLIERVVGWSPYDSLPPKDHVFAHQQKIILEMDTFREDYDSLNAHLLGKGGQNFKHIHDLTGAWLWLRGEGSGGALEVGPLHILIEHDNEAELEHATRMAQELIDSVEARYVETICRLCGGPHFAYRCSKANSEGYLKEMRSKGTGKGCPGSEQRLGSDCSQPYKRARYE